VPVTVTDVQPDALTVNVAAPVLDEFAATVTGWGRFQLLDESVIELPELTDRPVSPDVLATLTEMLDVGSSLSDTPNTSLCPCDTENVAGFASSISPDPQDPVGDGVGDGVGEAVGDGVGDAVGDGVGDAVAVAVGVGVGDDPLEHVSPFSVNAVGAVFVPL
jgi:hypothetical protein